MALNNQNINCMFENSLFDMSHPHLGCITKHNTRGSRPFTPVENLPGPN